MLTVPINPVWFSRILHALRDVELAHRQASSHDASSIGLEEIGIRLGVLRAVIEKAIDTSMSA